MDVLIVSRWVHEKSPNSSSFSKISVERAQSWSRKTTRLSKDLQLVWFGSANPSHSRMRMQYLFLLGANQPVNCRKRIMPVHKTSMHSAFVTPLRRRWIPEEPDLKDRGCGNIVFRTTLEHADCVFSWAIIFEPIRTTECQDIYESNGTVVRMEKQTRS